MIDSLLGNWLKQVIAYFGSSLSKLRESLMWFGTQHSKVTLKVWLPLLKLLTERVQFWIFLHSFGVRIDETRNMVMFLFVWLIILKITEHLEVIYKVNFFHGCFFLVIEAAEQEKGEGKFEFREKELDRKNWGWELTRL